MNIKKFLASTAISGAVLLNLASPALAAPNDQGQCRQDAGALFVASSTEGTRGDFMSDVIFGNEPNMADGSLGGPSEQDPGTQANNVLSSWSPGPFVNTGENLPPRNDRTFGFTGGDLQGLVKLACE